MGREGQPKGSSKPRQSECLPVAHDGLLHFTRCLRFAERDQHLQNAPDDLRGRISHWFSRVQDLRSHVDARADGEFWTTRLADHMADFRSKPQPRKHERSLATTLNRLHIGSRSSQVNIPTIRVGDRTLSTPNIAAVLGPTHRPAGQSGQGEKGHEYKGLRAGAVYFKDGKPYSHPRLPGSFPDQATPVVELLARDGERSVLMEPCDEGMLRWFHIPANNMKWVEEAIARHFNEVRPERGDLFERAKQSPRTHEILRRVGWRGHSREGVDRHAAPHTRQLDPGCEVINGGPGNPNAMCLFVSELLSPFVQHQSSPLMDRAVTISPLGDGPRLGEAVQVHRPGHSLGHLAGCVRHQGPGPS
jgi:hypothetical protein